MKALCLIVALSLGCAEAKPTVTSAHSADGQDWPLCVAVTFRTSIPIVKDWRIMACGDVSTSLAEARTNAVNTFRAQHPDALMLSEVALPRTLAVRR